MQRQLILISNPGNPQDDNYIKTTEQAIDRWEHFFQSPIGGFWQKNEILRFGENKHISAEELRRLMIPLNTLQCNYSIIIFCGHGCCTSDKKEAIQLPIPITGRLNMFPIEELFGKGIPHIKRTVILDACRIMEPIRSAQLFEERQYSEINKIDGKTCQEYYNSLILDEIPHIEVLFSTSLHHAAYGSHDGSEYADAVSNHVRQNAINWKIQALNDEHGLFNYSMHNLQEDMVTELVKKKKQIPEYKIFGTAKKGFPFVAMRLPTSRTIHIEDAIVGVTE